MNTSTLTIILLPILIFAWVVTAIKSKKPNTDGSVVALKMGADAALALLSAFISAASNSPLSHPNLVLLMLTVIAVARLIVPGKIFNHWAADWFFWARWVALGIAMSLTSTAPVLAGIGAGLSGSLIMALTKLYLFGHSGIGKGNPYAGSRRGGDKVLRGSKLVSSADLASQIRARFSGK